MRVIFYAVDDDMEAHRIGPVTTDATRNIAIIPLELEWVFRDYNVVEPDTLALLSPMDGNRFLQALPRVFRGTRVSAVEDTSTDSDVPSMAHWPQGLTPRPG